MAFESTVRQPQTTRVAFYNDPKIRSILYQAALAAIVISAVVGIPLGVISAVWAGRWPDRLITPASVFLGSMPIFWLGLMAVLVFYRMADLLPAGGRLTVGPAPPPVVTGLLLIDTLLTGHGRGFLDALRHLVLPASILSVIAGAALLKSLKWARPLALVLGLLGILDFPIGTMFGCYVLWVLWKKKEVTSSGDTV